VYVLDQDQLVFHRLGAPSAEDIQWVARRSFERAKRLLRRRGLLDSDQLDESNVDPLGLDQPALAECYSTAVQGLELFSKRSGRSHRLMTVSDRCS